MANKYALTSPEGDREFTITELSTVRFESTAIVFLDSSNDILAIVPNSWTLQRIKE